MKVPARSSASSLARRRPSFRLVARVGLSFLITVGLYAPPARAQEAVILVGSGSSVPAPLYNRWTQEYGKRKPNMQMRYLPVGTSEGIKEISHGAGDFGAGEAQLTEKERKEGDLIELPVVLIAIVPSITYTMSTSSFGFLGRCWPRYSSAM
jgi:ABC-type phosphate transport system substrate-binding protein